MRTQLEQAKNDFYSGNMEIDSRDESQEMRPSIMENEDDIQDKVKTPGDQNFSEQDSSEEISDDFNEEEWLKKWAEENPEVLIPKEKMPDTDLDIDPEFDLESFVVD